MAALTFRLLGAPPERLDLAPLSATGLAGKSMAEIARIGIGTTRAGLTVGDLFAVTGDDPADIRFEGGSERFDRIGFLLAGGAVRVEGDVGAELGRAMTAGTITVAGSAGPLAGTAMTGGTIRIAGDAGDFAGGALHGAMAGQAGGAILVSGRVGDRAGDRMKRGLIVALGGTGAHAGSRMSGGTILTTGLGAEPGTLMKRGTLIAAAASALGPGFVHSGGYELPFLRLFARHVAALWPEATALVPARAERWRGDMATLGKGEVLIGA